MVVNASWDGAVLGDLLPLSWVGVASGDVDSKSGKGPCPVPPQYLSNGAVSLRTPGPALSSLRGLGERAAGALSFRPEEVYVFQSTGGSGLWERLMVIVGWACEGPSSTLTSCCAGWAGGCRRLPVLCATNIAPQREERRKGLNSCW